MASLSEPQRFDEPLEEALEELILVEQEDVKDVVAVTAKHEAVKATWNGRRTRRSRPRASPGRFCGAYSSEPKCPDVGCTGCPPEADGASERVQVLVPVEGRRACLCPRARRAGHYCPERPDAGCVCCDLCPEPNHPEYEAEWGGVWL